MKKKQKDLLILLKLKKKDSRRKDLRKLRTQEMLQIRSEMRLKLLPKSKEMLLQRKRKMIKIRLKKLSSKLMRPSMKLNLKDLQLFKLNKPLKTPKISRKPRKDLKHIKNKLRPNKRKEKPKKQRSEQEKPLNRLKLKPELKSKELQLRRLKLN